MPRAAGARCRDGASALKLVMYCVRGSAGEGERDLSRSRFLQHCARFEPITEAFGELDSHAQSCITARQVLQQRIRTRVCPGSGRPPHTRGCLAALTCAVHDASQHTGVHRQDRQSLRLKRQIMAPVVPARYAI